jgi:uncharacterized protein (TIGR03435 family)
MHQKLPYLVAVIAVASLAQTAGPAVSFEVASVKASVPSGHAPTVTGGPGTRDPGRVTYWSQTLAQLVNRAYSLNPWQQPDPRPLGTDKYDIVAAIPVGATRDDVNIMLQNLLAERFGLVAHRELRELPLYELVVAKGGPKLKEPEKPQKTEPGTAPSAIASAAASSWPKDSDGWMVPPPGVPRMFVAMDPSGRKERLSARMQSIAALVMRLQSLLKRPVVDKTGLSGVYDFTLTYPSRFSEATVAAANAYFAAVRSSAEAPAPPYGEGTASEPVTDLPKALEVQLGLKLENKKGPIEVLVIDKFNPAPVPD